MTIDLEDRYSRQALFAPIGAEGQRRLAAARVTLVGCGGLGTVSAGLLGRAGVGFLRIVDRDVVELSNLQRQALFTEDDVRAACPKAVAAARHLAEANSEVTVEPVVTDVDARNVRTLIADVDLVVDGLDNFEGRYLLNEACVEAGRPWVYGACVQARGISGLIVPGRTPCLRCLNPDVPASGTAPTCDTVGVLGSATHATAAMQVATALRYLVTHQVPRPFVLLSVDVWEGHCERIEAAFDETTNQCPCCAGRRFELLDVSLSPASALCGRNAVLLRPASSARPDLAAMAARVAAHGEVVANEYLLRLHAEGLEITVFADGRTLVKGLDSPERARAVAARLLGT